MTVLFSRKCEYALQGILYLAEHGRTGPVSAQQISTDLDISREFISKTLQQLVKEGFVVSSRGKAGGFKLARDPSEISLLDITLAIDGEGVFQSCVLGLPTCGSDAPCAVHEQWGPLREATRQMLANTSVDQVNTLQH